MSREALLKVLVQVGVLSEMPTPESLTPPNHGVVRILAKQGRFKEREALEKVAEHLNLRYFDLNDPVLRAHSQLTQFLDVLTVNFCKTHLMLPLYVDNGVIVTAVANPLTYEAIRSAEFSLGKPLKIVLAEEQKILRLLAERSGDSGIGEGGDAGDAIETLLPHEQQEHLVAAESEEVNSAPVIKICNKLIADAIAAGASDIHVEPLREHLDVRYRIDGKMRSVLEIPKRLQPNVITRLKLISGMDIAERRRPQDGRIRVRVASQAVDLRASSVPAAGGEKIVLRVLQSEGREFSFRVLGMPHEIETAVLRALKQRSKLLLTTGPTGSGKTTTLYTFINALKDGSVNIETVENPVELKIPGISQIQVNEAAGVTFASALRSLLRQDPDVIMVGEIRDLETAEIAMQAAQTGHLVISSLHTNDAPSAVTRLVNLGVSPYVVAASLSGVLAQRLVRKVCPHCAMEATLSDAPYDVLAAIGHREAVLRAGPGCAECNFIGYKGRVGIYSYLEIDQTLADMIQRGATPGELSAHARTNGFQTLEKAAADLVAQRLTTYDEAQEHLVGFEREQATARRLARSGEAAVPQIAAIAELEPASSSAAASVTATVPDTAVFQKPKILVVDDDADVRTVFNLILRQEMFDVIEATNGKEALERVYEHRPTVILCDLMMPVMSGKDFLVRMRANPQTRDIPIVILTAAPTEANEVALLELGARDFISKSSSAAVITSRLRRVLGP